MDVPQTRRQLVQRHIRRFFNPAKDIVAVRVKTPRLLGAGFDRNRSLVFIAPGITKLGSQIRLIIR